ncbi:MAG: TVP38/TMEM64 family protein, partial [bacterium]|nr:TVP38/TMEM64 family protein [bacterium]
MLAALAIAVFVLPVKDWLTELLEWLQTLGTWTGPLLLVLIYIPLTVLMVPGTIPTLGAGFAFGVTRGTIAVSIGSVLGSAAAFALGRTLLRDYVQGHIQERPRLRAVDAAVKKDGFRICLLLRLTPIMPYNLVGYVLGATPMRARDHFFASWMGMLPATA